MERILLLDNYDSFTYNLKHLLEKAGPCEVEVVKNDRLVMEEVAAYDGIVLSPGPGIPSQAGAMPELLKRFAHKKSILGICLGMQAIGEHFLSPLENLNTVFHGLATPIKVLESDHLFQNCPLQFLGARYHSWVVKRSSLHQDLIVTAEDESGLLMGIRHSRLPVFGLQFHPESILSEYGETILGNWLNS